MRLFLKFNMILIVIIILTSIILPQNYGENFPRHPGPTLDRQARTNHLKYIEENHPNIVLLGDSTLVLGIDSNALAEQTNQPVYSIGIPGSASALWYVILKNNIADADYKTKYVLVVFRDSILTAPGYRVHGSYFDLLDEYARRNEPVLLEKSFLNFMSPFERMFDKYLPLYALRSNLRQEIDTSIRYAAPPLFGCDEACTDYALAELFQAADLEPRALGNAVNSAESLLYTKEQLDFESVINESLLPDMIEIAKYNNINLVFVRIKVFTSPEKSPALDQYLLDLKKYFEAQDVHYLEFGNDPRLTEDLYQDTIHLNQQGKAVFTELVAQGLNEIFLKK